MLLPYRSDASSDTCCVARIEPPRASFQQVAGTNIGPGEAPAYMVPFAEPSGGSAGKFGQKKG